MGNLNKLNKCHICGKDAEYECEDCGELVCDSCTTPYTIHNQIQYTQCIECGDDEMEARSDAHFKEVEDERVKNGQLIRVG